MAKKAEMDRVNEQQIQTLADFVDLCNQTVADAQALIESAQGDLELTMSQIEETENERDNAASDRDLA